MKNNEKMLFDDYRRWEGGRMQAVREGLTPLEVVVMTLGVVGR